MTYQQTLDYLYARLPMFTRIGAAAYKKDLTNTIALCESIGNPQKFFKSIHIAGTNGKGSVSHFLSSILQEAGYKVGLYTSPHLIDFRERMRVNGQMISEVEVIDFVDKMKPEIEKTQPSFFEMTVAMAFDFFRRNEVDFAVIETGLGGRLDSTNIVTPLLSVITNVSFDHQNMLGNTLEEISAEKAGIIKTKIPVVIGETHRKTAKVFKEKANLVSSPIIFADEMWIVQNQQFTNGFLEADYIGKSSKFLGLKSPLAGNYQLKNIATVLQSVEELQKLHLQISRENIFDGILKVKQNTGLLGRWEILGKNPLIIADVAHNEAGINAVLEQVQSISYTKLHVVYGMLKDKDIEKALKLLPKNAQYYFCHPDLPRALPANELQISAEKEKLQGISYISVKKAYNAAISNANEKDLVLIIGSIFIVAEVLAHIQFKN